MDPKAFDYEMFEEAKKSSFPIITPEKPF